MKIIIVPDFSGTRWGDNIDYAEIIKSKLKQLGRDVTLVRGENKTTGYAVVEQTWRKNKSRFEDSIGKAGRYYNDYYYYIGPFDLDVTALSKDDYFIIDGKKLEVIRTDAMRTLGKTLYYRAILKRLEEGDGNVFE